MAVRITDRPTPALALRPADFALRVHADPTDANRRTSHLYAKRELADDTVDLLVPWCQYDPIYPERHARIDIELSGYADADWCVGCWYRARR
ncbi:hypothetical protein [Amycolatopsis sp. FDAARGOS 1241]|uniref:hypothetical protein n=1 Tax=Amycolatopsis sp. FDAARGOS 1241 TaxID=2778070 RepID=UPI00194DEE16|nr:hypothetical protein [Amycolatopsis sp. FDAARGOS 1241]QRP48018.1 hypothetical protein I6J71_09080 [Amycolatopsis sp. FDAARGOS 1241]